MTGISDYQIQGDDLSRIESAIIIPSGCRILNKKIGYFQRRGIDKEIKIGVPGIFIIGYLDSELCTMLVWSVICNRYLKCVLNSYR